MNKINLPVCFFTKNQRPRLSGVDFTVAWLNIFRGDAVEFLRGKTHPWPTGQGSALPERSQQVGNNKTELSVIVDFAGVAARRIGSGEHVHQG